jgi:hypothetical protein
MRRYAVVGCVVCNGGQYCVLRKRLERLALAAAQARAFRGKDVGLVIYRTANVSCYNLFASAPVSFLFNTGLQFVSPASSTTPTQLATPIIGPERAIPLIKPSSRGPPLRLP